MLNPPPHWKCPVPNVAMDLVTSSWMTDQREANHASEYSHPLSPSKRRGKRMETRESQLWMGNKMITQRPTYIFRQFRIYKLCCFFLCVCIVYFDWYGCFWSCRAKSSVLGALWLKCMQPSASRGIYDSFCSIYFISTDYGFEYMNLILSCFKVQQWLFFGILTRSWSP